MRFNRKIFVLAFSLFFSWAAFAGPFGLSKGMTLEQIAQACGGEKPVWVKDDIYWFTPVKAHSSFKYYVVYVNEEVGLYSIRVFSAAVSTNEYGNEIKNMFYDMTTRLSKTYGRPEIVDRITDSSYLWDTDNHWLKSLKDGAREFYALWYNSGENVILKDDIEDVELWAEYENYNKAILYLQYDFTNKESAKAAEDDVL